MSTAPDSRSVVRSTSGVIATVVTGALGLFLLGDAVLRAGWAQTMSWTPWVLLVIWAIYVSLAASTVAVTDHGVEVQNLLRRHRLPWGSVTDIYMKYQVTIEAGTRRIACWAGPSASRPPRVRNGASGVPRSLRLKESLEEVWESRRHDSAAQGTPEAGWDWVLLGIGAVLVVWSVGTLLF